MTRSRHDTGRFLDPLLDDNPSGKHSLRIDHCLFIVSSNRSRVSA
jgi:hypothetical protein